MPLVWLALLAPALLLGQGLETRAEGLIKTLHGPRAGMWGVHIVNLDRNATLADISSDRLFVPASAAKLFTAALAFTRLGPEYRFLTRIVAASPPDEDGRLKGDLVLVGGGDPSLDGRPQSAPSGQGSARLAAIEQLAWQVIQRGVRRIEGDIIGDDSAYPWEPYPEGRSQEDALWHYGAPVGALSISENRVVLTLSPGRVDGEPARLRLNPRLEFFVIDNRVRTVVAGETRIEVERLPGSRQLKLWGTISRRSGATSRLVALDDPAEYAAAALHDALTRLGVQVDGRSRARHAYSNETTARMEAPIELARHQSPPLSEILSFTLQESPNLHAELLLREVGRVRRQSGTRQAGLDELKDLLQQASIPAEECQLVDGSGLSRYSLITPRALTALLGYLYRLPESPQWLSFLPAAGEEGTLKGRLTAAGARVRAKTGSMNRISALAGYAVNSAGQTLAFAIVANNFSAPAAEIRSIIDKIVLLALEGDK